MVGWYKRYSFQSSRTNGNLLMAAYTVYLEFSAGKGSYVEWNYPGTNSPTSTGSNSYNPLDLDIGDTVTFKTKANSFGGGTVSGLAIFTNNANFTYSGGTTETTAATRTVATGSTLADTITATQTTTGASDNFYFERQGVTTYSVTSGAISMDGVRDFLTTPSSSAISMSQFYRGGSLVQTAGNSGVPASGAIDLADLYGVAKPG